MSETDRKCYLSTPPLDLPGAPSKTFKDFIHLICLTSEHMEETQISLSASYPQKRRKRKLTNSKDHLGTGAKDRCLEPQEDPLSGQVGGVAWAYPGEPAGCAYSYISWVPARALGSQRNKDGTLGVPTTEKQFTSQTHATDTVQDRMYLASLLHGGIQGSTPWQRCAQSENPSGKEMSSLGC